MQSPEPYDDQPPPVSPPAGNETIIKFVLSGPILAEHANAQLAYAVSPAELTGLRERVDVLERAVADAHARLEVLSRALAGAIPSTASIAQPGSARGSALTAAPTQHTIEACGGMASVPPPLALQQGAGLASAASLHHHDRDLHAVGASREPEQPEPAIEPKARGLRRMISVLKHN